MEYVKALHEKNAVMMLLNLKSIIYVCEIKALYVNVKVSVVFFHKGVSVVKYKC